MLKSRVSFQELAGIVSQTNILDRVIHFVQYIINLGFYETFFDNHKFQAQYSF